MSERAYLLIVSVVFLVCCHGLLVVRRVPLRAQVATEGMKSWHGCRLQWCARALRASSGSMRERYTERLSGGELVLAARAAAPCDIQARPFACVAERQLAIPE
jgi:hypothetical protein